MEVATKFVQVEPRVNNLREDMYVFVLTGAVEKVLVCVCYKFFD